MAREFTRSEFYELIWTRPMTHLAKEFALSDVALHKICRKHGIPTPPLGWWAKRQAGKKVRRTPLPAAGPDAADRIVIAAPELRGETPAVADVREAARIRASDHSADDELEHPGVERTIAMLRSATPSPTDIVAAAGGGVIACEIAPASIDRLATILRRIVAAASHQGYALETGERDARFVGDGETIGFSVVEQIRRGKHELTAQKRNLEDAWRRKTERPRSGNLWDREYGPRPMFFRMSLEIVKRGIMRWISPMICSYRELITSIRPCGRQNDVAASLNRLGHSRVGYRMCGGRCSCREAVPCAFQQLPDCFRCSRREPRKLPFTRMTHLVE